MLVESLSREFQSFDRGEVGENHCTKFTTIMPALMATASCEPLPNLGPSGLVIFRRGCSGRAVGLW